jgi:predicted transcriptional regulator
LIKATEAMKTAQTIEDVHLLKLNLMQQLLTEDSTTILKEIGDVFERNRIVAHTVDGRPLNREDYLKEMEEGREQARQGLGFTTDEVKAKMAEWGKRA